MVDIIAELPIKGWATPPVLALFERDANQVFASGGGGHVPRQGGRKTFSFRFGTGDLPA